MTEAGIVPRRLVAAVLGAGALALGVATAGVRAQQAPGGEMCRVTGRIDGLGGALPGVALTARRETAVAGVTSTQVDGTYQLRLAPGAYRLSAELAGFSRIERDVVIDGASCATVIDLTLVLRPRGDAAVPAATPGRGRGAGGRGGRLAQAGARAAARGGAAAVGFQTLEVSEDAAVVAALEDGLGGLADAPTLLLPPGFDAEASADAIAVTGDAARIDRGMLNDRRDALARGDFALLSPEALAGALEGGLVGRGALAQAILARGGGPGGRGGGDGAFFLGGRGGRGRQIQATADYTFGGSALDASPYQLRAEAPREERPYTRQNFGGTIGGPMKIPGLLDGTRSSFTVQYSGGVGSNLFDQYATVPTDAMRAGDFSASAVTLVDPATGQPFAGNQIPADRLSPQALALLRFYPSANLDGDTRNYHYTTTTASANHSINARVTHSFTDAAGGGRGGRGGGGRFGGGGGRGRGAGTSVTLNTQLRYRQSDGDQTNVFATLGGRNESSSLGVPVSLNIGRGRQQHQIQVNLSRTTSRTVNQFTGVENVAAAAGIGGVPDDPFAYGLPSLSFTSLTGLRDVTPSRRSDTRVATEYAWTRVVGRHTLRVGGDFRYDRGSNQSEPNANGHFVFTGLYSSGGSGTRGVYDVADFLLGLPQQASVQYGPGDVALTGRSMSLFVMDDWRTRGNLTVNLGLRYELLWPFVERQGQLVNLDVAPDFSAAAPVMAGQVGRFSGEFPEGLLLTDTNNIAPRLGLAWRGPAGLVVRGGYGVSFNSGSYAAVARELASQPPFALTNTQIGRLNTALLLEDALTGGSADETTNNFGIDKDYVLGRVQTWNVDVMRTLGPGWALGGSYTHTRGSSLDIVRAPNRDAGGLRIDGVQPFTWQSAEGESVLHSATFRLQRRQVRGLGGQVQYTIARSRDNAPSIGGGRGGVVAQNDQDLESEWGLSNFDRRHRLSASASWELPFGADRRWLYDGGVWAALFENWRLSATFSADAGTPLTPRVSGAARDVAQGLNGALRADYSGAPAAAANPTIDQYFNTAAFSVPATGLFGTSPRNIIIGPGSRALDAQLARDVRLGGTRALTIQLRANNLLNMVNYTSVDTFVNSPTFGQVLGVRPLRSLQLNLRFRF